MRKNELNLKPLKLQRLMFENDLSRHCLRYTTGIGINTFNKAVSGKPCSVRTAAAIADALGVQLEEIVVDASDL